MSAVVAVSLALMEHGTTTGLALETTTIVLMEDIGPDAMDTALIEMADLGPLAGTATMIAVTNARALPAAILGANDLRHLVIATKMLLPTCRLTNVTAQKEIEMDPSRPDSNLTNIKKRSKLQGTLE